MLSYIFSFTNMLQKYIKVKHCVRLYSCFLQGIYWKEFYVQKDSFYVQRTLNSARKHKKRIYSSNFVCNRKREKEREMNIYKRADLFILVSFWVDVVRCMCKYYVRYTSWDNEKKKRNHFLRCRADWQIKGVHPAPVLLLFCYDDVQQTQIRASRLILQDVHQKEKKKKETKKQIIKYKRTIIVNKNNYANVVCSAGLFLVLGWVRLQ